jgi:hypothetical protein
MWPCSHPFPRLCTKFAALDGSKLDHLHPSGCFYYFILFLQQNDTLLPMKITRKDLDLKNLTSEGKQQG